MPGKEATGPVARWSLPASVMQLVRLQECVSRRVAPVVDHVAAYTELAVVCTMEVARTNRVRAVQQRVV